MSAYLVVDITVHDPEMYQEYVRKAPPYIEKLRKENGARNAWSSSNFQPGRRPMHS